MYIKVINRDKFLNDTNVHFEATISSMKRRHKVYIRLRFEAHLSIPHLRIFCENVRTLECGSGMVTNACRVHR